MSSFTLIVLPIYFSFMFSKPATTCAPPLDDPDLAFQNANLVFDGLVIRNELDFPFYIKLYLGISRYIPGDHWVPNPKFSYVTFKVFHSWKTISNEKVQLIIPYSGFCSVNLQKGERYVIYAYQNVYDGELITGLLFQTKPINTATEDLFFLQSIPEIPLANPPLEDSLVLCLTVALFTILITATIFARKRTSS